MISRQNILQLLGTNKSRYHSCIITSYSFSFQYFERRVLPILRGAGIVNINILVDGNMLDQQMEMHDAGNVYELNKSYSISPVNIPGAFHPKILLAVGHDNGLLAIGSGNLTGAGMSFNEEIWGAFQYHDSEPFTVPLFHQAISFLSTFENYAHGINKTKINWIIENSKWYSKLSYVPAAGKNILIDKSMYSLISSFGTKSILRQVLDLLPPNPKSIKVLSPFYNEDGTFLESLWKALRPAGMHCLIDPEHGTIPLKMEEALPIQFSKWQYDEKDSVILHAKAYQFEYANESYFLFGSPNATTEAFGSKELPGANAEMAIMIAATTKRDFFKDMGIDFAGLKMLSIDSLKVPNKSATSLPPANKYPVRINHAELFENEISITFKHTPKQIHGSLIVFDVDGNAVFQSQNILISERNRIQIDPRLSDIIYKIVLQAEDVQISNFAVIQRVEILQNTHPDSRLGLINEILSKPGTLDGTMLSLFSHIDWNDLLSATNYSVRSKGYNKEDSENQHTYYDAPNKLTEAEFNAPAGESIHSHRGSFSLLDVLERTLRTLPGKSKTNPKDIKDSAERISEIYTEEGFDDDDNAFLDGQFIEITTDDHFELKRLIYYALKKIGSHFTLKTQVYQKLISPLDSPLSHNTTQHLQLLLIGFHLLVAKLGKVFPESRHVIKIGFKNLKNLSRLENDFGLIRMDDQTGNNKETVSYTIGESYLPALKERIDRTTEFNILYCDVTPSKEIIHPYILINKWPEDANSEIEIFITNSLSTIFLSKLKEQFNKKSDTQNQRTIENILLERIILTLSSYHWGGKQHSLRDLLLLNSFYLLSDPDHKPEVLIKNIEKLIVEIGLQLEDYTEPLNLIHHLYTQFSKWFDQYKTHPESLKHEIGKAKQNRILFSRRYGFAKLLNVSPNKHIDLYSPLGRLEPKLDDIGFSDIYIGEKAVFFN